MRAPFWKGPDVDGITQSLISRYLVDKERFRILTIDGLKERDKYSHRLEYGSLWHVCEETLSQGNTVAKALANALAYSQALARKYPANGNEIEKWYQVAKVQFPLYVDFWRKHPDVKGRTPIFQEQVFKVPYQLPSGRYVILRGKWDAVDAIEDGLYLQENKAKGEINADRLIRELQFELQTMTYAVALSALIEQHGPLAPHGAAQRRGYTELRGVRYNVVRRPLSGRQFNIIQRKGRMTKKGRVGVETKSQFYDRLGKVIQQHSEHFFMRWRIELGKNDLAWFQRMTLNPILENLTDDYEWWAFCKHTGADPFDYGHRQDEFPEHRLRHYLLPYGIYNPLTEGRDTEYDEYLASGDDRGLVRAKSLFGELE